MMSEIELQPLRITSGWLIEWNLFYEVDPSDVTMQYLDASSLLHIENHQLMRAINLDFKQENDANGFFHLRVLNLIKTTNKKGNINYEGDWEEPYFELKTKNRLEIVKKIEQLVLQLPPYKNNN